MFAFGETRARRRPSLTPMIDVVFLLLVFFMLASRFGSEVVLDLSLGGGAGGAAWQGAPRLVDIGPDELRLNGVPVALDTLVEDLGPLLPTSDAPVILRAQGGDLQRVIDVMEALQGAGITQLVLVEGGDAL